MTGTLFRIYNDYFVNVVIVKAMRVLYSFYNEQIERVREYVWKFYGALYDY